MEPADLIETIMFGQSGLPWAQSFRRARIRLLTSDDAPFHLAEGCALFLHIIPSGNRVPINFRDNKVSTAIRKHGSQAGTSYRSYNADGFMHYATRDSGKISSYLLYMRSGIIEQCTVYRPNAEKNIPGQLMDSFLVFNIVDNVDALIEMGEGFPMVIFTTLIGAKDWTIAGGRGALPIDRNIVWTEGLNLQDNQNEPNIALAPLLDAIWNCSGVAGSPYI